jgi:pilus assembly protein TadC
MSTLKKDAFHRVTKAINVSGVQLIPEDYARLRDMLVREFGPLLEALETIANEDYRGNRPLSAVIAWKALDNEGVQ